MTEDRNLLWLDLETTGSDDADEIIEIGCLMTDSQLNFNDSFGEHSWVVQCSESALLRMTHNVPVREMHQKNGLFYEIADNKGEELGYVESQLMSWLTAVERKPRQIMLAGSGVGHFDRRVIRNWLPDVDEHLHYAPFDIGNIRRAFQAWNIPLPASGNKELKTHRALDDAKLHLDEARAYKDLFEGHLRFEAGHDDGPLSIAPSLQGF
jgi:oligoribonuclease